MAKDGAAVQITRLDSPGGLTSEELSVIKDDLVAHGALLAMLNRSQMAEIGGKDFIEFQRTAKPFLRKKLREWSDHISKNTDTKPEVMPDLASMSKPPSPDEVFAASAASRGNANSITVNGTPAPNNPFITPGRGNATSITVNDGVPSQHKVEIPNPDLMAVPKVLEDLPEQAGR